MHINYKTVFLVAAFSGAGMPAAVCGDDIALAPADRRVANYRQLAARSARAIAEASEQRALWRDTEDHLRRAERSVQDGRLDLALILAERALVEAQLAVNQAGLERARFVLKELERDPAVADRVLAQLRGLIAAHNGAAASRLARSLERRPRTQ
jgi:hypothetical protein